MRVGAGEPLPSEWRQQFKHESCDAFIEACEVLRFQGGWHHLREVVELRQAARAQEHSNLWEDAPERAHLVQRRFKLLADKLGAEVVVADWGTSHLHAVRAHYHVGKAIGGGNMARREQQRALGQVEIEGNLGMCSQLVNALCRRRRVASASTVARQLHSQVA